MITDYNNQPNFGKYISIGVGDFSITVNLRRKLLRRNFPDLITFTGFGRNRRSTREEACKKLLEFVVAEAALPSECFISQAVENMLNIFFYGLEKKLKKPKKKLEKSV